MLALIVIKRVSLWRKSSECFEMSIDIDCYTNQSENKIQKVLDDFIVSNFELLDGFYSFSQVLKIYNKAEILEVEDKYEQYHLESMLLIAEEYGFNDVKSMFVISVIDKTFSRVGLIEFSVMLKNKFGENNILILFNGESKL